MVQNGECDGKQLANVSIDCFRSEGERQERRLPRSEGWERQGALRESALLSSPFYFVLFLSS